MIRVTLDTGKWNIMITYIYIYNYIYLQAMGRRKEALAEDVKR